MERGREWERKERNEKEQLGEELKGVRREKMERRGGEK